MTGRLVRRLVRSAITLVWVFVVCFTLLQAMPGDPADRLDSPSIPVEQAERNRRALGLDQPVVAQAWRTVGSYARGDFGVSNSFNLIHGSDSPEAAEKELGLFFGDGELIESDRAIEGWVYDLSSGTAE